MAVNNSQRYHLVHFCVPAKAIPRYVCEPCTTNRTLYLATDEDVERHCIATRHINSAKVCVCGGVFWFFSVLVCGFTAITKRRAQSSADLPLCMREDGLGQLPPGISYSRRAPKFQCSLCKYFFDSEKCFSSHTREPMHQRLAEVRPTPAVAVFAV
jgi:hypothetical protein